MSSFQTGEIPHGFAFYENGGLIHYKHTILLSVPQANQGGAWGDLWLSFGCAWGDVKLGVSVYDGKSWGGVKVRDVQDNAPRLAEKLAPGSMKIAIGRMKKSAGDSVDDNPANWLIEYL